MPINDFASSSSDNALFGGPARLLFGQSGALAAPAPGEPISTLPLPSRRAVQMKTNRDQAHH